MGRVPAAPSAAPAAPAGTPLLPPTQCPACMAPLSRLEGSGAYALVCHNPACGAQAERALLHWADRWGRGGRPPAAAAASHAPPHLAARASPSVRITCHNGRPAISRLVFTHLQPFFLSLFLSFARPRCVKGLGQARVEALCRGGTVRTIADLYKITEVGFLTAALTIFDCVFDRGFDLTSGRGFWPAAGGGRAASRALRASAPAARPAPSGAHSPPPHVLASPLQGQWMSLDKVGVKLAAAYTRALRDSLQLPMAVALSGFGIP